MPKNKSTTKARDAAQYEIDGRDELGTALANGTSGRLRENSVRRNRFELATTSEKAKSKKNIPEDIAKRFVRVGSKYFFPDGARAFTDWGQRLSTPSENTEVIRTLIQIARVRGWHQLEVAGTERFRKEAWFAAQLAGIDVRNFKASGFEQAQLDRVMSMRSMGVRDGDKRTDLHSTTGLTDTQRRSASDEAKVNRDTLLTGKLMEHGSAPYRNDPHEAMSYFAKIETRRGVREIWGVDLQRAFRESVTQPRPGDEVALRSIGRDLVSIKANECDAQGSIVGKRDRAVHRNRWIVEKSDFFQSRALAAQTILDSSISPLDAVKAHPELAGIYLQMRAAELAAKQLRNEEDRTAFVTRVREALADSVARGDPLSPVRLRDRASRRSRVDEAHDGRDRSPTR
jgi:Large polyvalent protein-associated domain 7